jgi:hypothetical protein
MDKPVKESGPAASEAEVDIEAIMADIKDRARRNRQKAMAEGLLPGDFVFDDYPDTPAVGSYDPELYEHLRQVNQPYRMRGVVRMARPSPLTRLPVVGRRLEKVQAAAHNLVVFYVNTFAVEVIGFQRHIAGVLNRLVGWSQKKDREIQLLRQELEMLKERIKLLEARR